MKTRLRPGFREAGEEEAYLLQKLVDAGILVVSFARGTQQPGVPVLPSDRGKRNRRAETQKRSETRSDKEGTKTCG